MVNQRAGQKRKVVEVPRPQEEEDEIEASFDAELRSDLDSEESGESEEEEDDYDEDELDSDEIPSSDEEASSLRKRKPGSQQTPMKRLEDISLDDLEDAPNYTIEEDANGDSRYVYKDIEPNYDSDDSAMQTSNTIGNIPLSYYDEYPHIGYDINGKKISRPAKGEALDALLDSIDIPEGWTGLTDPTTGKALQLSQDELDVLQKLTRNEVAGDGYDPYPDMVEYFTGKGMEEIMPLTARPEPKSRFIPSKHEHKRVMKMVRAIKAGRIQPYKEPTKEEKDQEDELDYASFDIWANEAPSSRYHAYVPAPKLLPPGYEESYHPPPEYLPDDDEKKEWEAQDEEDRKRDFLPRDHTALRRVPGYDNFIQERMNRSLDLYLAPRVQRTRLNIDPESLLPKLPDPQELRPFPDHVAVIFRGHKGRVRCMAVDPTGCFVASGGDDGIVRIWDLKTGYCYKKVRLSDAESVHVVTWRPGSGPSILGACCGESVHFIVPQLASLSPDAEREATDLLTAGFAHAAAKAAKTAAGTDKPTTVTWHRPIAKHAAAGVMLSLSFRSTPKTLNWHRRGDYFTTVSPSSSVKSTAVAIHTLSKHLTQHPFRRLKGLPQTATFHPSKPLFFAATRQNIRVYDLQRQMLEKTLKPGVRWISSISLHSQGDNMLVSSFDRRLLWHDLDTGVTPYKTLRYHTKAIRDAKFHPSLPLFADASDDGSIQVFHGRVMTDEFENATIVPLKVLKGHKIANDLGVLALDWHPREAWCVSAGADGTLRLWV